MKQWALLETFKLYVWSKQRDECVSHIFATIALTFNYYIKGGQAPISHLKIDGLSHLIRKACLKARNKNLIVVIGNFIFSFGQLNQRFLHSLVDPSLELSQQVCVAIFDKEVKHRLCRIRLRPSTIDIEWIEHPVNHHEFVVQGAI